MQVSSFFLNNDYLGFLDQRGARQNVASGPRDGKRIGSRNISKWELVSLLTRL